MPVIDDLRSLLSEIVSQLDEMSVRKIFDQSEPGWTSELTTLVVNEIMRCRFPTEGTVQALSEMAQGAYHETLDLYTYGALETIRQAEGADFSLAAHSRQRALEHTLVAALYAHAFFYWLPAADFAPTELLFFSGGMRLETRLQLRILIVLEELAARAQDPLPDPLNVPDNFIDEARLLIAAAAAGQLAALGPKLIATDYSELLRDTHSFLRGIRRCLKDAIASLQVSSKDVLRAVE